MAAGGSCSVLVRGFDFGTTDATIQEHMASVGAIGGVQWVDDGSMCVTYTSVGEAQAAVAQLQQSKIAGNRRYIDVISMDPQAFLAEHNIDQDKAQQFFAMNPKQQVAIMARGSLSTARDPTAVLVQRMKDASTNDFSDCGGGSVLVRGFDFGTTEAQLKGHMATVGSVESVQWVDDGSVCVTYTSVGEGQVAVASLNQSKVPGNRRYLDVISMDPQAFLSEHNIDTDKAQQFFSMTPKQQVSIMSRGTLATARDPTAVLVQRMQQAKGTGKGPAKGFGMASGPYGGGKGGGKGMEMMMTMMKGMMKGMAQAKGKGGGSW